MLKKVQKTQKPLRNLEWTISHTGCDIECIPTLTWSRQWQKMETGSDSICSNRFINFDILFSLFICVCMWIKKSEKQSTQINNFTSGCVNQKIYKEWHQKLRKWKQDSFTDNLRITYENVLNHITSFDRTQIKIT